MNTTTSENAGLVNRLSLTGLIRGGFGLVTALIALLAFGAFHATDLIEEAFKENQLAARQKQVLNEVFEDVFEARIAALKYRASGNRSHIADVDSNIEEVLDVANETAPDRGFGLLATLPNANRIQRDILDVLGTYGNSFRVLVAKNDKLQESYSKMTTAGREMLESLNTVSQRSLQGGNTQAVFYASKVKEEILLSLYYAARFIQSGDVEHMAQSIDFAVRAEDDVQILNRNLSDRALLDEAANVSAMLSVIVNTQPEVQADLQERDRIAFDVLDRDGAAIQNQVEAALDNLISSSAAVGPKGLELVERTHWVMGAAGIISAALAALIAFAVSNFLTRRITSLADTTDQLAKDNLDVLIEGQDRTDETGRLARALVVFRDNRNEARRQEEREQEASREREAVVSALSNGLAGMASGDLTVRMHSKFSDEFEPLRQNFNGAIQQLEQAMSGVMQETHNIKGGAENLSSAADELARRTEGQAAALEETAATIVQLSDSVTDTASGAEKANSYVNTAQKEAEGSLVVVSSTVEAIRKIQTTSAEVSQIIGVIDDIAFQTNLLALNAGVEAARAGDAGQGFAVVASEVRALAQRASKAAKEIKDLIETSVTQVDEGVVKADQTGDALGKIVGMVTEISELVETISAATRDQSDGLKEINAAVSQLDSVTQQNAAMVEETTAASHDLSRNTEELTRITDGFRTGGAGATFASSRDPETRLDDAWAGTSNQAFG